MVRKMKKEEKGKKESKTKKAEGGKSVCECLWSGGGLGVERTENKNEGSPHIHPGGHHGSLSSTRASFTIHKYILKTNKIQYNYLSVRKIYT